ncbi:transcription termination factor Rho [Enorma massiliensis]|uniref:transcription termination factor Rho n=3 Tax=Enorma massiliensis TaxID=1472761 RepID=UPI003AEFD5EA
MAEDTNTTTGSGTGASEAQEKPRRTTRARRTTKKAEEAKPAAKKAPASASSEPDAPSASKAAAGEVTAEVAQARALAQISQASIVRKQRRAAARAEEALTAPAKVTRTRRTKKAADAADAATAASGEAALPDDAAQASEPAKASAKPRSTSKRTKKAVGDADKAAADAATVPAADDAAVSAAPAVDPALRPHRRGRKPKAYVEAERAAAAALAAAQAASAAGGERAEAPAAPDTAEGAAPVEDHRPGRARRAADDGAKRAPRKRRTASDEAAGAAQDAAASGEAPSAGPEAQAADAREAAADERAPQSSDAPDAAEEGKAARGKRDQGAHRTHAQRNDRAADQRNDQRNDRRNRQQNRKARNNRNAPVEPSLSREDLAAMKVAELREKARELDLDITGKKKAELVEEVYVANARAEGFREITGILDISHEGFGHIRAHGYMPSRDDAFVPANLIRAARLRAGDLIEGTLRPSRPGDKFPGLSKIKSVNGLDPEEARKRPKFSDLTPIYPNEQLKMEHGKDSITGRAIDIVSPIGKGQRSLIVSPPKAGKTTILKKICQSIAANNPEVHLICLLVDERPEEVTDMQRSIKGDVVASTFDMPADNHTRVSELVIERAKRIVEMGGDVVVVLDSITRLARAYNLAAPASGRILSGGVDSAALYPPKRFLGAARNIENGGSLTILASALIDTGSKMDEVIFEEFKGTGNMELKLDRDLADRRIFPAIDPVASGTRNEDLLIDPQMRPFVWGIRRVLANMSNTERCASAFIKGLKQTNTNEEFLIRSAKRAQDHGEF